MFMQSDFLKVYYMKNGNHCFIVSCINIFVCSITLIYRKPIDILMCFFFLVSYFQYYIFFGKYNELKVFYFLT